MRIKMARALLALVAGASLVAPVATASGASAIETPEPDPITYNVVISHPTEIATISVTTHEVTPRGYHCASVWSPVAVPALLGRACSFLSSTFLVPLTLHARTFPIGRSRIEIVDDAVGPLARFPDTAYIVARRLSSFGKGIWQDKGQGNLFVSAPILFKDPITGKLRPQNKAPVSFQEFTRRGWRTRATFLSVNGIAQHTVHLGPGIRIVRVYRVQGGNVTAVTGVRHKFNLLTEPIDPKG